MPVEKIISTLTTLEKMHKSLYELATKKTDYIKSGSMEELNTILKNEQAHIAAIEKLEQQRQQLVVQFLSQQRTLIEEYTVSTVINYVQNEQQKQQLMTIRDRFTQLLVDLKAQNELNQKLTFQSLQFVNLSLEMMRPQQAQAQTMNYSGEEVRGTAQVNKKSYFDSQA